MLNHGPHAQIGMTDGSKRTMEPIISCFFHRPPRSPVIWQCVPFMRMPVNGVGRSKTLKISGKKAVENGWPQNIFPFLYLTSFNFEMFGRQFCGMLVQQVFDMSEKKDDWQALAKGQRPTESELFSGMYSILFFHWKLHFFFKGMQICF